MLSGTTRRRPARTLGLEVLEDRVVPAFDIVPTFGSSITQDPNAAVIIAAVNRTLAAYENTFSDDITVNIRFNKGGGLGSSVTTRVPVAFADYRAALVARATTADDATALASLPAGPTHPIPGTADDSLLNLPSTLVRALGLSGGVTSLDGTITLNTSATNNDRTQPADPAKYDLMAVVAHEVDEVLGLGSGLDGSRNGDPISVLGIEPADLFRYAGAGTRSFSTAANATAYFSIDGGTTNLAGFNQIEGGDFGDWDDGGSPRIQDAFGTPAARPNFDVELWRLDVIGYTRSAPATFQLTPPAGQASLPGVPTAFALGRIDTGSGPFRVTVDWGDGTPAANLVVNDPGSLGTQSHTYATAGAYTVTVSGADFTSRTGTAQFDVTVDANLPTVTALDTTRPDGAYGVGSSIPIQVTFSRPVFVTGTPTLRLNSGGSAGYVSGDGTATLTFAYVVGPGQTSPRLDATGTNALALSGGTIQDGSATPAVLTLPAPGAAGSLGANSRLVVDTTPPTITLSGPSVAQTTLGPVTFTVQYADANFAASSLSAADVTVIATGSASAVVSVSGSGTTRTVALSQVTGVGTLSIAVAAGTAVDAAGNPAPAAGASAAVAVRPALPGGFAVGGNPAGPSATVFSPDGTALRTVTDFGPGFEGGVRVAVGDVTGDGVPDLIAGAGPGGGRLVAIDGRTGTGRPRPFGDFTGGLFVAAGDLNRDGRDDIVVTPDRGGGPSVVVYDGAAVARGGSTELARFFGIQDDSFRGGARAAVGDATGDGVPDLVVAAGFLGGPRVTVWGRTTAADAPLANFFAFEDTLRNGCFVAVGDLNGDGRAELVFAGGPGGGPRVRLADAAAVLAGGDFGTLDALGSADRGTFFAGDPATRGGVRVAVREVAGRPTLLVGSGEELRSERRSYDGGRILGAQAPGNLPADVTVDPFATVLLDGVFVG